MNDLLEKSREDLELQLLQEQDPDKIKEIINIFNLDLKKKEAIRINKLNGLQDKVFDQMNQRLSNKADCFSNSDLIDYYKTIQDSISKVDSNLDNVKIPQIQFNQQINVNSNTPFNRESRQKITDAVLSIFKNIEDVSESNEVEEVNL